MTDMKITASMVKELREKTGVGMMECKKALVDAQGDMDEAVVILKKSGQMKAEKKTGRTTAEGLISLCVSENQQHAVMVEVNCETDFVAREERFVAFVYQVAKTTMACSIEEVSQLEDCLLVGAKDNQTVEAARRELVAQLGENITIRRLVHQKVDSGIIGVYLHGGSHQCARIGALVSLSINNEELAKDMAMQVAAMRPEFLDGADVPKERIDREKDVFMAQAKDQHADKPDEVLEKIIGGKLNKFIAGLTLLGQPFVKEAKQTVEQVLKSAKASVLTYCRYEVGEGIEKKSEDFVEAVMSQVRQD